MRNDLFKRYLSTLLALVMVFSAVPLPAQAVESAVEESQAVEALAENNTAVINGVSIHVDGNGTLDDSVTGKVTVTATSGTNLKTTVITVENTAATAKVSFKYTTSEQVNAWTLNGNALPAEGTFFETMEKGEIWQFSLTANRRSTASVTFSEFVIATVSENSTVTVLYDKTLGSITAGGASDTDEDGKIIVENVDSSGLELTATAGQDATFVGWTDGSGKTLSTETTYTHYPASENETVEAVFASTAGLAWFKVGNFQTTDLNKAIEEAESSGNKTVVLAVSGTLAAGDYIIPEDIAFLIPHSANDTGRFNTAVESETRTSFTTKPYVTLTVPSGSSITVKGDMNVNAKQAAITGGVAGYVNGEYGHVALETGAELILESGSSLTCYGYITGGGTVTANEGSTVWELLQIADWRGGSYAVKWYLDKIQCFPTSQYYVQNIESNFDMYPGAVEKISTAIELASEIYDTQNVFVGDTGLFKLSDGILSRSYDYEDERMTYTVSESGEATVQGIKITINDIGWPASMIVGSSVSFDSTKYILAINNNLSFVAKDNSTINMDNDYKLLPESEVIIEEGSTLNVDGDLYLYGISSWDGRGYVEGDDLHTVHYSAERYLATGKGKGNRDITADSASAKLQIDGELNVSASGAIYTNSGDADNIISGTSTGEIFYDSTNTENKEIVEIAKDESNAPVQFFPARGLLAGKSTSSSDPQSFTTGDYLNTGADHNNFWYNQTITLTGEIDKVQPYKGTVIDGNKVYAVKGGTFWVSLPYGYTATYNEESLTPAPISGRMAYSILVNGDMTINIGGESMEPNVRINLVLGGQVVDWMDVYFPTGVDVSMYYSNIECTTRATGGVPNDGQLYMPAVAKVVNTNGTKHYSSVDEAVSNMVSGDTLHILTNMEIASPITIPAGLEVTVCLDGHKIDYSSTVFNVYGKLNLDLGGGTIRNKINGTDPSEASAIIVWPKGDLDLDMNGGTLTWAVDDAFIADNGYAFRSASVVAPVYTYAGSTACIDMTDGTISVDHNVAFSTTYGLHAIYNQGDMEITGGGLITSNTYRAKGADKFQDPTTDKLITAATMVNYGGEMNIHDGVVITATQTAQVFNAILVNGWSGNLTLDNVTFCDHHGVAVANTAGTIVDANNVTIIGRKDDAGAVVSGYGFFNYSDNEGSFKGTGVIKSIRNSTIETYNYAIRGEADSVFEEIGGGNTNITYNGEKYALYLNGCTVDTIGGNSGTLEINSSAQGIYAVNGAVINTIGGNGGTVKINSVTDGIYLAGSRVVVEDGEEKTIASAIETIGGPGSTVNITMNSGGYAVRTYGGRIGVLGGENSTVNLTGKAFYGIQLNQGTKMDSVGSAGAVINIKDSKCNGTGYGIVIASGSELGALGAEGTLHIESKIPIYVNGNSTYGRAKVTKIGGENGTLTVVSDHYGIHAKSLCDIGTIGGNVNILSRNIGMFVEADTVAIGTVGDGVKLTGHTNAIRNAGTITDITGDAIIVSLGTAEQPAVVNTGTIGVSGGYYYHVLGRDYLTSGELTYAVGYGMSDVTTIAPDTDANYYFVTNVTCSTCADNDSDHLCDACGAKLTGHSYSNDFEQVGLQIYTRTCSVCGHQDAHTYRWEVNDSGKLTSVGAVENTLTNYSGYNQLAAPFALKADDEWAVEWNMQISDTNSTGRILFSETSAGANATASTGKEFLFTRLVANYIGFGSKVSSYENYGAWMGNSIKMTDPHVYRLENRVFQDGTNMIYLFVDGVEIGPTTRHYTGGTDKNEYANWPGELDEINVSYIGTSDFGLSTAGIEYISVLLDKPCEHDYILTDEVENTCQVLGSKTYTCDICGYSYTEQAERKEAHDFGDDFDFKCDDCGHVATVSILGDSISTFDGVSNDKTVNNSIANNRPYYPNSNPTMKREDTWWQQTLDLLDLELCVNNAWSGSAVLGTRNGTAGAYLERCVQLHNNAREEPDIILVFMGTNDFSYTWPGSHFDGHDLGLEKTDSEIPNSGEPKKIDYTTLIQDNGDGTFSYPEERGVTIQEMTSLEAYAVMIHKMQHRYPNAQISCMSLMTRRTPAQNPTTTVPDVGQPTMFNKGIKSVADHLGVNYIEMENLYSGTDHAEFQYVMADNRVHPSQEGMDLMTQAVATALLGKKVHLVDSDLTYTAIDNDAEFAVNGDSYHATVSPALDGTDLKAVEVTVTMGGSDITDSAYDADSLEISIDSVTGDVMIEVVGELEKLPANFYWAYDSTANQLVSKADSEAGKKIGAEDNALTRYGTGGTITDGIFDGVTYSTAVPVQLKPNEEWYVEWKAGGRTENWKAILLADAAESTLDRTFLFKADNATTGLLAFGHENPKGTYQNYSSIALKQLEPKLDLAATHVYRIENRIAKDGSNMPYLLIDGVEIGVMNNYFIASGNDQKQTSDWFSGETFNFTYIGAAPHKLTGVKLEYLSVHRHEYGEWSCEDGGIMTRICAVCGEDDTYSLNYYWEFDSEQNNLVSKENAEIGAVENALTKTAGTITNGMFSSVIYDMAKPVQLYHNQEWYIEWRSTNKSDSRGMLFASDIAGSNSKGTSYLFKADGGLLAFGEITSNVDNYGIHLKNSGVNITEELVYRIENRIANDGSNMAYLVIDGVDYGPMNNYYKRQTSQSTTVDWMNGADLVFSYIGSNSHPLTGMTLDYLTVHYHKYGDWMFEDGNVVRTCEVCGEEEISGLNFHWEFDSQTNNLASNAESMEGAVENALTRYDTSGTVTNGKFSNVIYSMDDPVRLYHDKEWYVEWTASGNSNWKAMLFTSDVKAVENRRFLFKGNKGILAFGYQEGKGTYHNYGYDLDEFVDVTEEKTYRIENRIAYDGSNMAYLLINGEEIGPMHHSYNAQDSENKTDDWFNGKDFEFFYIGSESHPLTGVTLKDLTVHYHDYGDWKQRADETYIRTCETCGADQISEFNYIWKYDSASGLVSCGPEDNEASKLGGTTTNRKFVDAQFSLANAVQLSHDSEWVIEWKCAGDWNGMLLSSEPELVDGMELLFKTYSAKSDVLGLGYKPTGATYQNSGYDLANVITDWSAPHTYRLENKVENGSNMVYLSVDGGTPVAMNGSFKGSSYEGSTTDWLDGQDFTFGYIGAEGYAVNSTKFDYLAVREASHKHYYVDGVCSCGKTHISSAPEGDSGEEYGEEVAQIIGDHAYATLQEAIAASAAGDCIQMLTGSDAEIAIDKAVLIDLNGNAVNGVSVTASGVAFVDSTANGYDVPAGKVTVVDGAENIEGVSTYNNGLSTKRYVRIANDDGSYSFHRVGVSVTAYRFFLGKGAGFLSVEGTFRSTLSGFGVMSQLGFDLNGEQMWYDGALMKDQNTKWVAQDGGAGTEVYVNGTGIPVRYTFNAGLDDSYAIKTLAQFTNGFAESDVYTLKLRAAVETYLESLNENEDAELIKKINEYLAAFGQ